MIEDNLINFLKNHSISNWNMIFKNIHEKNNVYVTRKATSAFIYQNPNLKDEYTNNVTETYYNNLYIQILQTYLNSSIFNVDLIGMVEYIVDLRTEYKKKYKISKSTRHYEIQAGCKLWLNYIYTMVNKPYCVCKCNLNYQNIISHIGRSIMSSIFTSICRDRMERHIIYIDTDNVVTENFNISSYFKTAAPELSFHTEKLKRIMFENKNIKKRNMTY